MAYFFMGILICILFVLIRSFSKTDEDRIRENIREKKEEEQWEQEREEIKKRTAALYERVINDEDRRVRMTIICKWQELSDSQIKQLCQDEDWCVRAKIASCAPPGRGVLHSLAKDKDSKVRKIVARRSWELANILTKDEDPLVRAAAIKRLLT